MVTSTRGSVGIESHPNLPKIISMSYSP
jgi:hypothetical protein